MASNRNLIINRNLMESVLREDDDKSKKLSEKIKGWVEAIRKRVLELGKI